MTLNRAMRFELDFRSGIPIYLQIVERVKELLANGTLKAGDQLPTVRALAQELRINFNTVARAYRILDEMGVISTQQGRGTYILAFPPPETLGKMREQALVELTRRYLADATQLEFSAEEILRVVQKHLQQKAQSTEERSKT